MYPSVRLLRCSCYFDPLSSW